MSGNNVHAFESDHGVLHRPIGQPEQLFRIVRLLPAERGGPQYRIRSEANGQERVTEEVHLAPAAAPL